MNIEFKIDKNIIFWNSMTKYELISKFSDGIVTLHKFQTK